MYNLVEYFIYLGYMIGDVRFTCELKSRIITSKAAFSRKKKLFRTDWTYI
jgi:hypothetical protein